MTLPIISSAFTTMFGCTRLWAICRPPTMSGTWQQNHLSWCLKLLDHYDVLRTINFIGAVMKKILPAVFALLLLNSNLAIAITTQTGVTPTMVGIEGNGTDAYIGISPNTNYCAYGGVYFTSTVDMKIALSIALSAKMAGKTVRVDFNQPQGSGTQCFGVSIYAE